MKMGKLTELASRVNMDSKRNYLLDTKVRKYRVLWLVFTKERFIFQKILNHQLPRRKTKNPAETARERTTNFQGGRGEGVDFKWEERGHEEERAQGTQLLNGRGEKYPTQRKSDNRGRGARM